MRFRKTMTNYDNTRYHGMLSVSLASPRLQIKRALLRMVRQLSGTSVSRNLRTLAEDDGAALSSTSVSMCGDWVVQWKGGSTFLS